MAGLIFINTDNYPMFCNNRCENTQCSKHIAKAYQYKGGCKISKLRETEECPGCIPVKRKKGKENE